ncbi:MAG: M20 family metallopeptidase [Alphaproteobacteria bacterium]|nr:M20 family metallopeptidase [Alphaproteobacteria bacterium]
MTRAQAISKVEAHFDSGAFIADLARRVAIPSTAQEPDKAPALRAYLTEEMGPSLAKLGFTWRLLDNPAAPQAPMLVGHRVEDPKLPTVFTYGHGDVIRGLDEQWRQGLSPWVLKREGDRYYGRGTADNKGQHSINLAAMQAVIETRGRLGFNVVALIEVGEEIGSPGLREVAELHRDLLKADFLVASDGPRLTPDRPTIYMGTRGALNFDLTIDLRPGGHHSGNWGGLLANPGVLLAHAIASVIDVKGKVLLPDLKPRAMPNSVRNAIHDLPVDGGPEGPQIDHWWGEPGLTAAEKVFGWNTFEVLAFRTGNPERPVNAVPPRASAHCQIRYTIDTDPAAFLPALQRHFDAQGLPVKVTAAGHGFFKATRLDPDHPIAQFAAASVERTTGRKPAMLPNLGGSLPNDVFADVLGLPTIWVPHSYASCSQHAPNEHVLGPILREGLAMMAGIWWDIGEGGVPLGKDR